MAKGYSCDICGEDLLPGKYHQFSVPLSRSNPYPDDLFTCEKSECIAEGTRISDEAYEACRLDDENH